ncbi:hypothetical protein C0995_006707 [Termitomyces sp. Mi166|nr:hypothetical protein C0995_006707 [Termitomyces sp. Mi166\
MSYGYETFVEIYPFGLPDHDDFTPGEGENTLEVRNELLQINKRLRIEKDEWKGLESLNIHQYETNEEWIEVVTELGHTEKSTEELTALVARLTKISEDFEAVIERLKVIKNPNKKAQLRHTLSGFFPFAEEENLTEIFSLKDGKVLDGGDDLKEGE